MTQPYDLAVIGGGPAGYSAAIHAAKKGVSVVLIEKGEIGGTCLNRGCIPSKIMLEAASLLQNRKSYLNDITINRSKLFQHRSATINRLRKGIEFLMKKNKITVINGEASIRNEHTIEVKTGKGEENVQSRFILLATGSVPRELKPLPANSDIVMNSDDATQTEHIPETISILGAGAVGVEFAYIYRSLGSQVTLIEAADRVLPGEDTDISNAVKEKLEGMGIRIVAGKNLQEVYTDRRLITVVLEGNLKITSDKCFCSVGRRPNTEGLRLEEAGIRLGDQSQIHVNRHLQTSIPNIYAAGDVTGRMMLAHVAISQAVAACDHMFGDVSRTWDGGAIPRCIYISPEIACSGLTEQEAREREEGVKVQTMPFLANGKAVAAGEEDGFIKVIANRKDQLLGVHMFGPRATDMISQASSYISNRMTVDQIAKQIFPHPTYSETLYEAILAIDGKAIHY